MIYGGDLGTVELGGTLAGAVVVGDGDGLPGDPTALPAYRVYGDGDAAMSNGTGSASKLDSGTITGATNAAPISVTSAAHGLQTGTRVTVSSVTGNTAANGGFTITRVDANTFTLDGSVGNGAYVSGGSWHVSGLYKLSISVAAGDGYEAGQTYGVLLTWTLSSVTYSALYSFAVV